jgi:hypothetical protein
MEVVCAFLIGEELNFGTGSTLHRKRPLVGGPLTSHHIHTNPMIALSQTKIQLNILLASPLDSLYLTMWTGLLYIHFCC